MAKRFFQIVAFLLAVLPAVCFAQPAQSQPSESDLRQQARQELMQSIARLPTLGKVKADQLVEVTLQNNWFRISSGRATSEMHAFELVNSPGVGELDRRGPRADALMFNFSNVDNPGCLMANTIISGNLLYATISYAEETFDGRTFNVQLIQNARTDDPNRGVALYIQDSRSNKDGAEQRFRVFASDARHLLEDYPDLTNQFIRPIFDSINLHSPVFSIRPEIAWQVLTDGRPPDAATMAGINAATAKLASDDYATREEAIAQLQTIGVPAAIYFLRHPPGDLTAEQTARLDTFLQAYKPMSSRAIFEAQHNESFLIDCLACEDASVAPLALARLRALVGTPVAFDAGASFAQRADAASKLRRELLPSTRPAPGRN